MAFVFTVVSLSFVAARCCPLMRRYVLGGKMEYFQYYGIDWVAMVLTFLAIWQIGNKNKIGFILMMCGNTSWVAVGYLTGSVAMIIANI
ncbi:hypothetical protein HJ158_25535 [Vibrio parahaemolyticus]|nr:hypothetical protein [Vibrio parahaemolyticus]